MILHSYHTRKGLETSNLHVPVSHFPPSKVSATCPISIASSEPTMQQMSLDLGDIPCSNHKQKTKVDTTYKQASEHRLSGISLMKVQRSLTGRGDYSENVLKQEKADMLKEQRCLCYSNQESEPRE